MDIQDVCDKLKLLPGVRAYKVWERSLFPPRGKPPLRIYIRLTKQNGGLSWNGGEGLRGLYLDMHTGSVVYREDDWAGSKTRARHEQLGTLDSIARIGAEYIESKQ